MDTHEITGEAKEIEGAAEKGYGKFRDRARQIVNDLTEQSSDRLESFWEESRELVREHPGQSLAISALVGFALGATVGLLSRDR